MIEPKNGEWWLCERGGVKTAFLRKDDEWRSDERDTYSYCDVVPLFKMIEDKPSDCAAVSPKRTRTEYEKVTESIFDLRDEFERGELYEKGTSYHKLKSESDFAFAFREHGIYRKIEKEDDWHSELNSYLNKPSCNGFESELPTRVRITLNDIEFHLTDSEYLESCRVALRANGEIG